jgi:hypothetical protein
VDITRRGRLAVAIAALGAAALTGITPAVATATPAAAVSEPVATSVARATLAQSNSILRLYRAYFLRDPDRAGLAHWTNQYSSGRMSLAAISDFFARSDEFKRRYGSLSDADFVRLVYQNVLGRLPDSNGQSHWTAILRRGTSRGTIMMGFSESVEFQRKTGTFIDPDEPEPWETALLKRINAERAAIGLAPLTTCPPLTAEAVAHSADRPAPTGSVTRAPTAPSPATASPWPATRAGRGARTWPRATPAWTTWSTPG